MAFGLLNRFPTSSIFDEFDSMFFAESPFYTRHPTRYVVRRPAPVRALGRSVPAHHIARRYETPSLFDLFSVESAFDRYFNKWDRDFFPSLTYKAVEDSSSPKNERARQLSQKADSPSIAPSEASTTTASNAPNETAPATSQAVSFFSPKKFGAVSRKETDDGMEYAISLPGLSLDDVKLDFDLKGRTLTLAAEKKTETKNEQTGASYFSHVSVKRQLPLPDTGNAEAPIKPEDIAADLENGILKVSVAYKKAIEAAPAEESTTTEASPSAAAATAAVAATAAATTSDDSENNEGTSMDTEESPVDGETSNTAAADETSAMDVEESPVTSEVALSSDVQMETAPEEKSEMNEKSETVSPTLGSPKSTSSAPEASADEVSVEDAEDND